MPPKKPKIEHLSADNLTTQVAKSLPVNARKTYGTSKYSVSLEIRNEVDIKESKNVYLDGPVSQAIKQLQEWHDNHLDSYLDIEAYNDYGSEAVRVTVSGWRKMTDDELESVEIVRQQDKIKREKFQEQVEARERAQYEQLRARFETDA